MAAETLSMEVASEMLNLIWAQRDINKLRSVAERLLRDFSAFPLAEVQLLVDKLVDTTKHLSSSNGLEKKLVIRCYKAL